MFAYELWGNTDGADMLAVQKRNGEIVGFYTLTGRERRPVDLPGINYTKAHPRGISNFEEAKRRGELLRIR